MYICHACTYLPSLCIDAEVQKRTSTPPPTEVYGSCSGYRQQHTTLYGQNGMSIRLQPHISVQKLYLYFDIINVQK